MSAGSYRLCGAATGLLLMLAAAAPLAGPQMAVAALHLCAIAIAAAAFGLSSGPSGPACLSHAIFVTLGMAGVAAFPGAAGAAAGMAAAVVPPGGLSAALRRFGRGAWALASLAAAVLAAPHLPVSPAALPELPMPAGGPMLPVPDLARLPALLRGEAGAADLIAARPLTGQMAGAWLLLGLAVLLLLVLRRLRLSAFGAALEGVRASPARMAATGYRPDWLRAGALCLSAGLAAAAGAILALAGPGPASAQGLPLLAQILLVAVIGGAGPVRFAVLAAALVIAGRALAVALVPQAGILQAPGVELLCWGLFLGLAAGLPRPGARRAAG
ncbi:ABC transporter permease subunit [Mangrovicoccus algicola]|uniref:Branched-chain amino acid ABC transporter permease n=1 Tax=Mangrovicoccus algicola TaxID=2771008 RepID=A0A8J6YVT4_9RHOB|nr:hypothetical protein [Mangrovicoccus algicola]MBE3637129.1 hypothetical protein [Mangrovicoccus algicola]